MARGTGAAGAVDPHEFPQYVEAVRRLLDQLTAQLPPGIGVTLFLFDFNGPAFAYGSNANRADMIRALEEFLTRQKGGR